MWEHIEHTSTATSRKNLFFTRRFDESGVGGAVSMQVSSARSFVPNLELCNHPSSCNTIEAQHQCRSPTIALPHPNSISKSGSAARVSISTILAQHLGMWVPFLKHRSPMRTSSLCLVPLESVRRAEMSGIGKFGEEVMPSRCNTHSDYPPDSPTYCACECYISCHDQTPGQ